MPEVIMKMISIESLNDAHKANEMLVVPMVIANVPVHYRADGLNATDIKGEDGLR